MIDWKLKFKKYLPKLKKNKDIVAISIIFIALFTLFGPALNDNFLSDDYDFLFEASKINDLSSFFSFITMKIGGEVYRPFLGLTFLADYLVWKLNPIGYHLGNLLLHFGICVLIYFLAKFYFKNFWIAFSSSLLFAVYPNHLESIIWIAGRTDLLCIFFILLSLLFWHFFRCKNKKLFYILSLIFFILALFSKEMALVFPALLLGIDYLFYKSGKKNTIKSLIKRKTILFSPYLLSLMAFIWIRNLITDDWKIGTFIYGKSVFLPLKNLIKTPYYFIKYLINFPYLNKTLVPSIWSKINFLQNNLLTLSIIALCLVILLQKKEKLLNFKSFWPKILFCFFWIYFSAIPVYPILPYLEKNLANSRLLYLCSIGFCFLIGYLLFNDFNLKRIKQSIFVILIVGLGLASIINLKPWTIASAHSKAITSQIKENYSYFNKDSLLYFQEIPDNIFGAYIFRNGLESAISLLYNNSEITAASLNQVAKKELGKKSLPENISDYQVYLFRWNEDTFKLEEEKELVDLWKNKERLKILYKNDAQTDWDFTNEKPLDWQLNNQLALKSKQPYLILESKDSDPFIISPAINRPAVIFDKLEIEMKIKGDNEKDKLELYWTTGKNPKFDEYHRHLTIPIVVDNNFHNYKINLLNNPAWIFSGIIKEIRIDLATGPCKISIKQINLK